MNVRQYAELTKTRWRLDACGDPCVFGKFGHVFEYSDELLGAFLEHPVNSKLGVRAMRSKMRKLDGLGLASKQRASSEGSWLIHPEFTNFAAINKVLGIRKIGKPRGKPFANR